MASRTMTDQLVLPLVEAINQIPVLLWVPLIVAFVGFSLLVVSCAFIPAIVCPLQPL